MSQTKKPFDPQQTKELQDTHQSYGRGGVIIALVISLIVIGSFVMHFLF